MADTRPSGASTEPPRTELRLPWHRETVGHESTAGIAATVAADLNVPLDEGLPPNTDATWIVNADNKIVAFVGNGPRQTDNADAIIEAVEAWAGATSTEATPPDSIECGICGKRTTEAICIDDYEKRPAEFGTLRASTEATPPGPLDTLRRLTEWASDSNYTDSRLASIVAEAHADLIEAGRASTQEESPSTQEESP